MTNGGMPERVKGWLGIVYPTLERGGPALSLVLLLLGIVQVWYLLGVLDRAVTRNHALVERIITMQDAHRAELAHYLHCTQSD